MFADSMSRDYSNGKGLWNCGLFSPNGESAYWGRISVLHRGNKANYAAYDGHVADGTAEQLFANTLTQPRYYFGNDDYIPRFHLDNLGTLIPESDW